MTIYFWIAFAVSFYCLYATPSDLSESDNFGGSLVLSAFGFVLWPVFVIAFIKGKKNGN